MLSILERHFEHLINSLVFKILLLPRSSTTFPRSDKNIPVKSSLSSSFLPHEWGTLPLSHAIILLQRYQKTLS